MVERLSIIRQLELMRDLQRLANERWEDEQRICSTLEEQMAQAQDALDARAKQIDAQYEEARQQAEVEYESSSTEGTRQYESRRAQLQAEYRGLRTEVETRHSQVTRAALDEQLDRSWQTWAVFEAIKDAPRKELEQTIERLKRTHQELAALERDAAAIMKMRRFGRAARRIDTSPPPVGTRSDSIVADTVPHAGVNDSNGDIEGDIETGNAALAVATNTGTRTTTAKQLDRLTAEVREATLQLYHQRLARLFESWHPVGVLAAVWAALAVPCGASLGWADWPWIAVSAAAALPVTIGILAWLYPRALRRAASQYAVVRQSLADARQSIHAALQEAKARSLREAEAIVEARKYDLAEVHQRFSSLVGAKDQWKDSELGHANSHYPARLAELRDEYENHLAVTERRHRDALAAASQTRDTDSAENHSRYEAHCGELRRQHDCQWQAMAERWSDGLHRIRQAWGDMFDQCERLFPDWAATDFQHWPKPKTAPASIRFGQVTLDVRQIKHGRPVDERLQPAEPAMDMPALMTLQQHPAMVITAEEEGRGRAVELLELMMLRMLTAMPPGKIRLTILDPVGLGENFASFMHLADFDERLIASRIWTEAKHVSEQLVRLTGHMETVLQKYLRNEYATIHEYNKQAGEVAEPFQVLVVANFPANFSEESARRLMSIATSGPRCGVYTLLSIDRKLRMPTDFHLEDLLADAVHLDWQSGERRFRWRFPAYEHLPLELDAPPSAETFIDVVRAAGRAAKDAIRVEVPFSVVAPAEDQYWKGDSGRELAVPIGRSGATRLQSVRLGKGTSQHLLICGKTGSGKSTFLHALITNAALHYSPEQVELYLIDFKKGVEFKCYATGNLPHARVIAIESEREFGLSVLERLDVELRRRGDLFRTAGVQNVDAFRTARPQMPMPRIMLIIDEFQELFVEDDKLAQEAALLLDRLVRQGRAFGMHVLLGSQTLSGAYSLARSTMGQMAVRVALQCSEADAHLILSDERNTAARFLSRPGEAIYNDQNGLLVGNHPFQVVWLAEQERFEYLTRVGQLQNETGRDLPPPIVFEGNVAADPADNPFLRNALQSPGTARLGAPQTAWLGAAVAIKDPTAATFSRHAGSNLLVVGHREDAALGVLTTAVIALAAQAVIRDSDSAGDLASGNSRFYILDGTRPDSPEVGTWQKVADTLPQDVAVVGLREAASVIDALAAELARREQADDQQPPPIYVVIHNAGRFRDLRRTEDDFSFSVDRERPPKPDKQLAEILRNGPAWGIHTLVWCDSYNNVSRLFDRSTLREFEMRVVFQMSAADSTNLLDSPVAGKLRAGRGLFYSDEVGTLEKFRPYSAPSAEWLDHIRAQLSSS